MRKPSLIEVAGLGRKVGLFRAVFELGSNDDLARRLNVAPNTLSTWCQRSHIAKRAIGRLAQMLVDAHPCKVTLAEAEVLWHGPLDAFEAALLRRPPVDLLTLLRGVEPNLVVRLVQFDAGFAMVGGCIEISADVRRIPFKATYCFEVLARPGAGLMVFCADTGGWRLLAPGRLHPGTITGQREIFPAPAQGRLWFEDRGLHHFVFIEHSRPLDPLPSAVGGLAPLDSAQLSYFARQLAEPAAADGWRWAEAMYDVAG